MEKTELDRSRPFGTIYGLAKVEDSPLVYEQDGVHFGPDGNPLEKWSTPEKIAAEGRLALKRKAKEAALAAKREERERIRKLLEER